ncbi:hypothetical protein GJ496_009913 [Pomphorhynchus laevis]|nr:hypothetical protein GJ496_009913 [Pomphorhynchus laevis]
MHRRARSLSRFNQSEDIYEREGSVFSTKLSVRQPSIYNRSASIGPERRDIPLSFYDGPRLRRRAHSVEPYFVRSTSYIPLRATTPYRPYSLCDIDYYDRFNERLREPTYHHRYPYVRPSDTYVSRYLTTIDRLGRVNERMRELDYMRSLRALRLHTPTNLYKWSSSPWEWLSSARDDVHLTLQSRIPGGLRGYQISNPRDYYGRSFVNMETNSVDRVRSRYNYLGHNVDQKPSAWNAEDQVETGQNLLDLNDSTLSNIYESLNLVDNSRENLLMDRVGIVPRFHYMSSDFMRTKFSTDHSKRILNDFKRMKDNTMARLSTPWYLTQFS